MQHGRGGRLQDAQSTQRDEGGVEGEHEAVVCVHALLQGVGNGLERHQLLQTVGLDGHIGDLAGDGIAINSGAAIAREIADVTIKADSLEELVILKTIANSLQRRVSANYRFVLTFNSALIALGAMGILQPASSAMLHNLSTIGISLKSMTNLIPEEKAQKALAEKN